MSTQGPFRLDGRIAAVIGASSGIGEAVAVACARAGAHVMCLDLDGAKAETVANRLRRWSIRHCGHRQPHPSAMMHSSSSACHSCLRA